MSPIISNYLHESQIAKINITLLLETCRYLKECHDVSLGLAIIDFKLTRSGDYGFQIDSLAEKTVSNNAV